MDLEARLVRRWYGDVPPGWPLRLLAHVFAGVTALRRWLFRRGWLRSQRMPVPVLVVGNIGIGGAGKTPLVIALCEELRARGWSPGVVSRGYGRSSKDVLRMTAESTPEQVGDEPCLIWRRTGCPLAVGARRAEAGALLLAGAEVDVLIADDGLQHLALQRDIEIAVLDCERGVGNGRLLPAGPLREPVTRLADCDFVVGNGGEHAPGVLQSLTPMLLRTRDAMPLRPGAARPLDDWRGQRVHAVAGIGNPARFFSMLRGLGIEPIEHAFPDHHRFVPADLVFAEGLDVLMTEKDAVKCSAWAQPDWYSVPVRADLPIEWFDAVDRRLREVSEALPR